MLLVTTSLKETWGLDQDIVFLGEWCKTHSLKEIWRVRNFDTIPYIWEDRERMYSDVGYLRNLHEVILADLSSKLNEIHYTKHSLRFWRIIIGIWLGFFVHILYQRWSTIQSATKKYPDLETNIITKTLENIPPNDMLDFVSMMVTDTWNHGIFGNILSVQGKVKCNFIKSASSRSKKETLRKSNTSIPTRFKALIMNIWNLVLSIFVKDTDLFFINTYLPIIDEMKLNLRFKQVPRVNRMKSLPNVAVNEKMRKWECGFQTNNDFERFVSEMIPLHLPTAYLEGFEGLEQQTLSLRWPRSPKLIFTSNSHIFEDLTKFWIATKVEQGSRYVIGQHGGGPLHALSFQNEHELETCDRFFSTGYGNAYNPKMIPVGQFFKRKWIHNRKGNGLLVGLAAPYYTNMYQSTIQSSDYLLYEKEQRTFMDALKLDIQKDFIIRLHRERAGYNNSYQIWHREYPLLKIDKGWNSIFPLLASSRLIVCTYPGTTYNESLAANAPTVIFWNPTDSQMHPSSKSSFDELRRAGIFHDSPESAANHINSIWDDIEGWWDSSEVRAVVSHFTEKYCYIPDRMLDRLESALQDAMS